jgi:hypothetical protein
MRMLTKMGFVVLCVCHLAFTDSSRSDLVCPAWTCTPCTTDCDLISEDFCDGLCSWYHTEHPLSPPECADYVYSQTGPMCTDGIYVCPPDCSIVCECAPDEPGRN